MHGRAIHREHPQPTPLLAQPEAVNLLLQEAIETFKYLGVELFARFAEGLRSDHLRLSRRLIEYAIELIEFGLQGRARLIEQEQDEVLEGELASAGKVLRILAVGGDEGGTIERAGYFLTFRSVNIIGAPSVIGSLLFTILFTFCSMVSPS